MVELLMKHVPPVFNRGYMESCIGRTRFCILWCSSAIQPYSKFVHDYVCHATGLPFAEATLSVIHCKATGSTCEIRV